MDKQIRKDLARTRMIQTESAARAFIARETYRRLNQRRYVLIVAQTFQRGLTSAEAEELKLLQFELGRILHTAYPTSDLTTTYDYWHFDDRPKT